ncbi:hypothetical protein IL306_010773, partial [Fusarium sp. DS 682]
WNGYRKLQRKQYAPIKPSKKLVPQLNGTQRHGHIIPLQGDVTSKADLEHIVRTIADADGFVNAVVTSVGIVGDTSVSSIAASQSVARFRAAHWAIDPQSFENIFRVNLISTYYTIIAFLELLDEGNKRGITPQLSQVIAISSIGGFSRTSSTGFGYSTSKAALHHLMEML